MKPRRILLVSHSADRSGAPLFLLNFAEWVTSNVAEVEIDILLKEGGELTADFAAQGRLMMWSAENTRIVRFLDEWNLWGRRRRYFVSRIAKWHQKGILYGLSGRDYDLVFVNSFASVELIQPLASVVRCPIICRAPELKSVVYDYCGVDAVRGALPHIDSFIAVSNAVRQFMISDLHIDPSKIENISGFFRPREDKGGSKAAIREGLGFRNGTFLVCGCGSISWRKGVDLFVQIAANVIRSAPDRDIEFIWIGGDLQSTLLHDIAYDISVLGLIDRIRFIGPSSDPHKYYSASDVFALTSREDPFPLVALEAAHEGLPVICFDGPVGSTEFVSDGAGVIIPYLSVSEFSTAILHFERNRDDLLKYSEAGKAVVNRYSYESICNQIFELIERTVALASPSGVKAGVSAAVGSIEEGSSQRWKDLTK